MVLTPHQRTIMRSRSLSPRPRAPYLWHEREAESADRKGWYRVDYGPSKPEEMWYLPSFKDRMNFLERSVERATSEPRTRATSVPPTTVAVRRSRALSVDPLVKYPLRWRTSPFYYYNYRWPYSTFYDRYWPSLGPYSGRIWRLPWYRYPSSPLTASTYWRSYPPSRYVPRYYPSYLDYDYGYGGYYYPYLYPRPSRYDYLEDLESPYLSTTTSYRPRALDLDTDYRDKMLHDHVENMRHRLKSLAYSLDPSGPVPEIVIPERSTTTTTTTTKKTAVPALPAPEDKKYSSSSSSALEYSELPKLASRRQRFYPEDEHMKDNLRIQCLSHYKTTRTAAEYSKPRLYDTTGYDYWKPKQYIPTEPLSVMPESSLRANKYSSTKWEEPDTVFGGPSDKKPYSKVETGSSFFSTYGFTNRKKDYVAEKVRDYYYFGDSQKAISDGTTEEAGEEKKERRKKKKSKERDAEATAEATTASVTAAAAADHSTSEADPVSAVSEGDAGAGEDEEKERKKLEKKKRKQEREAAAKAAMEAELAALAAAEAELARLEAESSKTDAGAAAPAEAAPAEAAPAEVKSESAAEKCESSTEVVCEGVCVKPESLGEPVPSQTPPQVPSQEEPEAPQVPEEPQAAPETKQAVEPQTEEPQPVPEEEAVMEDLPPLKESKVEPPTVEEPQVEASVEETPVEPPPVEETPVEEPPVQETPVEEPPIQETPVEEPPAEEPTVEATPEESPAEPPVEDVPVESSVEPPVEEAPAEAPVEVEQIDEPQAEPAPEEPQVEEPKPEPPVEAQVEEPSVDEPVETAPKRRAAFDEDAGWLDTWDGEAAAPEAGAQEGQQLGTDESEEPATTQAEEARLGAQDDTEAPADATATTTDAADATPDADAAADAADAAAAAEAGTDDTADAADAAPSTRFDEDLAE